MDEKDYEKLFRRDFLKIAGITMGTTMLGSATAFAKKIQGFDEKATKENNKVWTPLSDRKIRVGIIGAGFCRFGAVFGFQHHPNVEVVAVSDLIPERCQWLAKATNCKKMYPSLEELVKDKTIEAVFIATDAPSHARHCILALKHGKHVACAVPAVFGSLKDAQDLYDTVKKTGLKYMMFETSMFRENLYAMRKLYEVGAFGDIVYTEGEYWHYAGGTHYVDSFKKWRDGMPPQWYPTHSDAYYVGVTNGYFTDVSAIGKESVRDNFVKNNVYGNPFDTEISFYKTNTNGMARMGRSAGTVGSGYGHETGRIRGTQGSYYDKYSGFAKNLPDITRPAIPDSMKKREYSWHHGGSHAYLTDEFVSALLQDRKPLVDVAMALNMTVGGIVAHQSAMKGGEWLKVPHFEYWK